MTKLLDLETGTIAEGRPVELALAHDADLLSDAPHLDGVSVLSVELPKFRDGRAFTQVRVLRERYGFEGEIRATGHIIPDQAQLLKRVGASSIAIEDEARLDDFRAALHAYRFAYQRPARPAFAIRSEGS